MRRLSWTRLVAIVCLLASWLVTLEASANCEDYHCTVTGEYILALCDGGSGGWGPEAEQVCWDACYWEYEMVGRTEGCSSPEHLECQCGFEQ